ncbi:class I histocompatibility antigen, F10 alpha chain-like [Plectropomus leopardus]|uniref:class I histocompatibility antigen, F10 alpha chain-like n=1 Tax=Plectropomus leopardus TaxID=160734 RepID=UPI001C4CE64C|nr:class I histocompatibility antigen, F10 alpha chain-like [Plectropomus leopardus]
MKRLLLLLLFCHVSSSVKHSMKVFFIASSGVPESHNFPDVMAVMLIDDVQAGYCDSRIKTAIPKQAWMDKLREEDPQYWTLYKQECTAYQQVFKDEFLILKQRLNQTGSVQILQKMHGCEWDDETQKVHGYQQYGYDGADFLAFDLNTESWVASKSQAVITKHFWDRQRARNELWKNYLTQLCPEWLRKHLNYGRSFLLRTERPSVSLLQKSPSSPVSCHATGFYPNSAMMFWRKDGEEIHEDVDVGEILPNHDGSFQMSVDLNVSSVAPEDWSRYECVFHLSGVKDDIITKLDKAAIRTNWEKAGNMAVPIIAAGVVLALVFFAATGVIISKRKTVKRPPSPPDNVLELCERLNPET